MEPRPTLLRAPGPLVVHAGLIVLCLVWGSTWLVIREGLRELPPLCSAAARFLLAGAVLALFARPLARWEGGVRPTRSLVLLYSLLLLSLPYGIIYWVETRLPSGLVSVLWSIYPLLLAVAAHLFLPEERLWPRQWAGLVLGFGGVALMLATDVRAVGPEALPAALVLLASPASTAIGTTLLKRRGGGTSSVLLNRDGTLAGGLLLLAAALLFERDAEARWTAPAVFSVLYLALAGTVLAFGLYFWLLRYAPATRLALVAYGIPVVALVLGATLGEESVGASTIAGLVLVLSGIALVMAASPRPATPPPPSARAEAPDRPDRSRARA